MNGHRAPAPSQFPPPVDSVGEFVKRELDPEEDRIDVGVVIVGGGPAGLACANRLLQLLADEPELMEKLGEVPVAVIEKGKACGAHNLSGAMMRPSGLQDAVPRRPRVRMADPRHGRQGQRLLDARAGAEAAAQADPAAVPQPRQPHGQRRRAVAVARPASRGRRRVHPDRDQRAAAAGLRRHRARDPLRGQGPRQGGRGARQLRARLGRDRARHRARRGHVGPSDRRRDQGVRVGREPGAAGVGARGQGGVGGRQAARPRDPHARLAASLRRKVARVRRLVDLPAGRQSRLDRVRGRARLHRRHRLRRTICSSCSRPRVSFAESSRAASASPGARRRSPRAATGRCPSPRRRGW